MGQNNLTFWSMFANSLFNRQKNMFCFHFYKPNKLYKQMEFTVLNPEQKVHTIAKHGTEVIKQEECFGFSSILCEHSSFL